jgi:hypothetical protein
VFKKSNELEPKASFQRRAKQRRCLQRPQACKQFPNVSGRPFPIIDQDQNSGQPLTKCSAKTWLHVLLPAVLVSPKIEDPGDDKACPTWQ